MDDYEPFISEFEEIESSLGSAGMGTDEYYRPAVDIDQIPAVPPYEDEMFSIFSDLFKDDYGFRPRFKVTINQIELWLKDRKEGKAGWPTHYPEV